MPNHIKNILKFSKKKYPNLFEELLDKDGNFDFNKIMPMPERLNLIEGSFINTSIKYVELIDENKHLEDKGKLEEENQRFIKSLEKENPFEDYREIYKKYGIKNLYDLGKTYIKNEQEYGYQTWYYWCINNWGTKWNAYSQEHFSNSKYNVIIFETAWSYPDKIIAELAKKYDFIHLYADEDIGNNCGKHSFKSGQETQEILSDTIRFANRVWDY